MPFPMSKHLQGSRRDHQGDLSSPAERIRFRACVYCTDKDGKKVKAMTAPSAPVLDDFDHIRETEFRR